jgi:hypothetical protein
MAKQTINIGHPDKGDGDKLRDAFVKVNENFDELYAVTGGGTSYHLGDDIQFVDIDPDSGTVIIQSGYDTGMPVYIKGGNCADGGVGGNVVIEAGGAPLPNTGTTGNVEIAGQDVTIEAGGGITTFSTNGEGTPYVLFPADSYGEQLGVQGGGIEGITNLGLGALNGYVVITTVNANNTTGLGWMFNQAGTLNTPLLFPVSFTAVLDAAHCTTNPDLSLTGPAWEFNLEWQVAPNGEIGLMADNGPLPSLVAGYEDGQTFEFTEADHGIPGYTLTIVLSNVVHAGPAGWTANLDFSEPPAYPSTIYSDGAIKLTSNENSLILGTDGGVTIGGRLTLLDNPAPGKGIYGPSGLSLYAKNGNQLALYWNADDATNPYEGIPNHDAVVVATISDWGGYVIEIATETTDKSWTFGPDGALTLPEGEGIFNRAGIDSGLNIRSNADTGIIYLYSHGSDGDGTGAGNIYINPTNVEIYANWNNGGTGERKWTFANDGTLNLPVSGLPNTAIVQSPHDIMVNSNTNPWIFDRYGDLTVPGNSTIKAPNDSPFSLRSRINIAEPVNGDVLGGGMFIHGQQVSINYIVADNTEPGGESPGPQWDFSSNGEFQIPGIIRRSGRVAELNLGVLNSDNALLTTTDEAGETQLLLSALAGASLTSNHSVLISAGGSTLTGNIYAEAEALWELVRDEDASLIVPATRPWAGMPSYLAYTEIMLYPGSPPGVMEPPINLVVIAKTASDAYTAWQEELAATNVSISVTGNAWTFGSDGNLTFPDATAQSTAFQDVPSHLFFVHPNPGRTFTATGTYNSPFATITAAINAAVTAGHNDANSAIIILLADITENITLAPGIFLTSFGTGTHGSPIITGSVTVTSSTGNTVSNHYSISNLRIVGPVNGKALYFTGTAPQKLFVRDMWIDAHGTGTGIYMDNTGSGSTLQMDIAHLYHDGSGDIYCIDVVHGGCYVTDIETSGATQVAAVRSGAVLTIDSSELDAVGDVVCETYGTGSLTITNSIINNTQANGNGIKLNDAGGVATLGNNLISVPVGSGYVVQGVSGTFLVAASNVFTTANTARSTAITYTALPTTWSTKA